MSLFEGQIPQFLQPNAPETPLFDEEGILENPEELAYQRLRNARRASVRNPFLGTSVPNVARAQGAGSLTGAISTFLAAGLTPSFGAGPFVSQLRAPQFQQGRFIPTSGRGGGGGGPRGLVGGIRSGVGRQTAGIGFQPQVGVGNATIASMSRLGQPAVNSNSQRGAGAETTPQGQAALIAAAQRRTAEAALARGDRGGIIRVSAHGKVF